MKIAPIAQKFVLAAALGGCAAGPAPHSETAPATAEAPVSSGPKKPVSVPVSVPERDVAPILPAPAPEPTILMARTRPQAPVTPKTATPALVISDDGLADPWKDLQLKRPAGTTAPSSPSEEIKDPWADKKETAVAPKQPTRKAIF